MRFTKNNYVVLEKEEIENIKLKQPTQLKSRNLQVQKSLIPYLLKRATMLGLTTGKKKKRGDNNATTNTIPAIAYSLFVKILNETKKVAIGKVVLRDKEQLVSLRAYQRGLVMHQLKYLDEIRPMDEIAGLDSSQKIDANELALGKKLVENLTAEEFDPGQYSDTYAKELEKLIEAKSKGEKITIKEEEKPEKTTDLLQALKASISMKTKSSRQKKSGGGGSK